MNIVKSYDFFQPEKDNSRIHIIGCGSVGSTIAENLVRCGIKNISLYDFDVVKLHNIANQIFREKDVGILKVKALENILAEINPELNHTLKTYKEGWNEKCPNLSGYVFLCVDNIETRRKIVEKYMNNLNIKAMFDVRTGLTSAQHYATDWKNYKMKQEFLKSMQFSHDEASKEVETSACGFTLGVVTTVRLISSIAVNNYINFVKGNGIKKFVICDGFNFTIDAF